jgi:hypothetical protein
MVTFEVEVHEGTQESLVFMNAPHGRALFLAFNHPDDAAQAAVFMNQLARMQQVLSFPGKVPLA